MKILAPVNNLASARFQIESGADEIYLGLKVPFLKKISFGGRGDRGWGTMHVLPDEEEFISIISLAHSRDTKVFFTANAQFLADSESDRWITHYLDQVRWVEAQGADGVIIGDIGGALLLRQKGIKTPFIASNFFDPVNKATLSLLAELGFIRATLPYQIRLEEILDMAKAGIMELEVFANGGCSLYDGHCGFKPHGGRVNEVPVLKVGNPCHNLYHVSREGTVIDPAVRCFSDNRYCTICSLPAMMEAGIAGIKLVGRAQVIENNAPMVRIFKKAVTAIKKGCTLDEIRRDILPYWWGIKYCAKGRCKYKSGR
jgi:U32 family peptidase